MSPLSVSPVPPDLMGLKQQLSRWKVSTRNMHWRNGRTTTLYLMSGFYPEARPSLGKRGHRGQRDMKAVN